MSKAGLVYGAIMKIVRIGFIGFGRFAQIRLSCLHKIEQVFVSGFYDPNVAAIDSSPEKFETHIDLIKASDAVIISVPPKLAPGYVVDALSHDTHVFCEKPAAISSTELESIKPHLLSHLILAYGFNHRQHGSVREIAKVLNAGDFGRILWMRGRYGKEVNRSYRNSWRNDLELNGGGILIDQGIHMVDLMLHLGGNFDGAQAVLSDKYLGTPGVEDNAFVSLFSTKSAVAASIHSTVTQWRYLFSLEIFLERGSIILNGLRTTSGNYGDEVLTLKPNAELERVRGTTQITFACNDSWDREIKAFCRSVETGEKYPYANYDDAVETTRLMDTIYRNAVWL